MSKVSKAKLEPGQTVAEIITGVLCEQLGVTENDAAPTASLAADLGVDSLDQIELLMAIEQEFSLEIADEDWLAAGINTVQDLVAFMEKYVE